MQIADIAKRSQKLLTHSIGIPKIFHATNLLTQKAEIVD